MVTVGDDGAVVVGGDDGFEEGGTGACRLGTVGTGTVVVTVTVTVACGGVRVCGAVVGAAFGVVRRAGAAGRDRGLTVPPGAGGTTWRRRRCGGDRLPANVNPEPPRCPQRSIGLPVTASSTVRTVIVMRNATAPVAKALASRRPGGSRDPSRLRIRGRTPSCRAAMRSRSRTISSAIIAEPTWMMNGVIAAPMTVPATPSRDRMSDAIAAAMHVESTSCHRTKDARACVCGAGGRGSSLSPDMSGRARADA